MSCYGCAREFGLFHREHACTKCGFGFCAECVKYRAVIPGKGTKESKVCANCFNAIKNPEKVARSYAPPAALQKRLDALESPGGPPVIVYTENRKMASLRRGLSTDDQKILDRLQKLQKERKEKDNAPSDSDLKDRLDKLKDIKPSSRPQPPNSGTAFYKPPDNRSEEEQTRRLMEGVTREVEIDASQPTPEQDIALRLAKLRGMDLEKVKASLNKPSMPDPTAFIADSHSRNKENISEMDLDEVSKLMQDVARDTELEAKSAMLEIEKDKAIQEQLEKLNVRRGKKADAENAAIDSEDESSEDDLAAEQRITKQILEEQALEERLGRIPDLPEIDSSSSRGAKRSQIPVDLDDRDYEPEELPWCAICNEDAALRCSGCDDDLYCGSCFREFHVGEDPSEHKTSKYTNKNKYK